MFSKGLVGLKGVHKVLRQHFLGGEGSKIEEKVMTEIGNSDEFELKHPELSRADTKVSDLSRAKLGTSTFGLTRAYFIIF